VASRPSGSDEVFTVGEWVTKDDVPAGMRWRISAVHDDGTIVFDLSFAPQIGEMECWPAHNRLFPFHIKEYNVRRVSPSSGDVT
jgi:hypothetical protein